MFLKPDTSRTLQVSTVEDYLLTWLEAFLIVQKATGLADGFIRFYQQKVKLFTDYCDAQAIKQIGQITPSFLRQFLLYLDQSGHNPGGRHAAFRSLRAFLNWYEQQVDPMDRSNPIRKVKGPRVPIDPLDPIPLEDVFKMVACCHPETLSGSRDKAILLGLLDTGARAQEFLNVNREDLDQVRGTVLIRHGKGHKPRVVYLGKKSKSALRSYLKKWKDNDPALWVTAPRYGSGRLTYDGLREVIKRRAISAHVEIPTLHSCRRSFALTMLRIGTDVYTLAKLTGHEGIAVLQRYLKQTS